ncbi:MAG: DUF1043 family protein [Halioglobus sp.]|nr:DUF1043 family protein [Halioglobus sp.]
MESPEYSFQVLLSFGIALAVGGLFIGWIAGKRFSGNAQKQRDLTLRLDQVLQDKKAYEDDVVEHFTETAKLLNTLTESYREVHNHLAKGADGLCQGKGPVSLEHIRNSQDSSQIPGNLTHIQPPLDYAPKTSPDEKGMLNEEFGLEREETGEPETTKKTG